MVFSVELWGAKRSYGGAQRKKQQKMIPHIVDPIRPK